MQTRTIFLLSILLGLVFSCRGCLEKSGPDNALDLPAADANAAFLVPRIDKLLTDAEAFANRATERAGAKAFGRLRAGFKKQFGFDPFSGEEYEALGIDPQGSAILFTEGASTEPLMAIALADRKAFDKKLRELIQKTDGASRFSEAKKHGFNTISAGRPFGDEVVPAFHWAYVGEFVLVAREAGAAGFEATLARLGAPADKKQPAKPTLRTDPAFRALLRKVPEGTAKLFVRSSAAAGVAEAEALSKLGPGAMSSITLGSQGFSSDTFVEVAVPGLEAALETPAPRELAGLLGGDAAAVVLSRAARPEGVKALRAHPQLAELSDRGLAMLGGAIGLDPEKEVLPLLAGPLAASVHITNVADLPQRIKAQRSLQSLLDSFHIVITAEVADPAAFLAMLNRSRAQLEARGIQLRTRTVKVGETEALVFEPDREAPRLGWALAGKYYIYGAGRGRIDKAIEAVVDPGPSLLDGLEGSVGNELASESGTTVAIVRLGTVADAARQITLNQGGAAIGIGAMLGALTQFVETVGDVAAAVDAEPGGLRLRVRERLR